MYVKVYSYHINPDKVEEYIKIQQVAERIYSEYVEKTTYYLKSIDNPMKWTELHQYESEGVYRQAVEKVNDRPEIKELYKAFLNVLMDDSQVTEEEYVMKELEK